MQIILYKADFKILSKLRKVGTKKSKNLDQSARGKNRAGKIQNKSPYWKKRKREKRKAEEGKTEEIKNFFRTPPILKVQKNKLT